ncbi:MAG: multicopper oxidase domain-containing protein [Acidimicrobiales bacterium]
MNHSSNISSLARRLAAAGAAATLGTLGLAGLGPIDPAGAQTATAEFDLCATTGTAQFPAGNVATQTSTGLTPVSFWGYAEADSAGCGAATVTHPGGPTLVVDQGDTVIIHLHNNLAETTGLDVGGQTMDTDRTGTAQGTSRDYAFTARRAGTFIYQAGLTANGPQEVALGLYGALVVRPAAAGQAYGDARSAYDSESVLVLSELDPALNPTSYAGFDMRNFAPRWGLINGMPFPATTPIPAAANDTVLLRYVNAGSLYHSMSLLGANQTQLATDGHRLPFDRHFVAETFGPGETADVLVHVPAAAATGTRFTLFDGSMSLFNNGKKTNLATARAFGGMMTFIEVGTSTGTTGGPATSTVAFNAGTLTATVTASGTNTVAAAEYFVDSVGATGSGTALAATDAAFDSATEDVTSAPAPIMLAPGSHTLYVRGQDSAGAWGPAAAVVVNVSATDSTGPAVSGATVTPAATNHTPATVTVAVHATADDTATGGATITGGELFVDTAGPDGTGTALAANAAAVVASIDGTIDNATLAGLTEGPHQVLIHAQDAVGNWGPTTAVTLTVDRTGPSTTNVAASPSPNNGTLAVNTSTAAVRVTGMPSDGPTGTPIVAAEMFLCTATSGCQPGNPGTGVAMLVSDGAWDETTESVYGDIPLATVASLSNGDHTIWVRGKDAAGNWGAATDTTLTIDKAAPTFAGITLSPASFLQGTTTVGLNLTNASDGTGTGVVGGEYWFGGTNIAAGTGTPFLGTSDVPIDVSSLPVGTTTVRVRIRDAAGNWSTGTGGVRTANLTVSPDAVFANGFDTGNRPWGWSAASTTNNNRLTVTTGSPLAGTRSLRAQGNNTNHVQYNFGGGTNPATPTLDAAFSFNPNNNAGSGQDIFRAASNTNFSNLNTVFRVRYRRSGNQPQVQIQVGSGNTNTTWTNVTNNAANRIEVVWQSGTSLQLYVNGTLAQTVTTTANGSVSTFRLGSVTSGGSNTFMYFDAFSAKRSITPLIG